jgi:hypothetical protein
MRRPGARRLGCQALLIAAPERWAWQPTTMLRHLIEDDADIGAAAVLPAAVCPLH